MTTTQNATTQFRKDVYSHGRRIEDLRRLIEVAEDEIAIHVAVLELAGSDQLVSAIAGSGDDENVTDLARYCAENSVGPPEGVSFGPRTGDGATTRFTAEIRRGGALMQITWGPDIGFVGHGLVPQLTFTISAPTGDDNRKAGN